MLLAAVRAALGRAGKERTASAPNARDRREAATLSKREREVLEGLVAGQANKIIAFDLGISPRTVEIYRANVMTKMGAAACPSWSAWRCWLACSNAASGKERNPGVEPDQCWR